MKTITGMSAAIVFAAVSSLAAQGQTPSTTQPTPSTAGTTTPVTVAGCVERTGSGPTATFKLTRVERPGASSSSTMGPDARPAPSAPGATTPAPGSSTTRGAADAMDLPREYVLKPSASVDLNPHANHKVEVTGTADKSASSTSGSAAPGASSTTPGASTTPGGPTTPGASTMAGRANDAPTLNVTGLKMIAATCS